MKQTKWFNLLLAAFLMFGTIFTAPVLAQDEDDPCIAAGTCEDTSGGDEYPEEYVYDEEQGISIIADGNTESRQLITTIDSVDTGAFLQAINGGKSRLRLITQKVPSKFTVRKQASIFMRRTAAAAYPFPQVPSMLKRSVSGSLPRKAQRSM